MAYRTKLPRTGTTVTTEIQLTPAQRKALDEYEFRLREEDRYLGSVFVNHIGQRKVEARTREAFEACQRLGMTHQHGL